jgi:hypothetical protein
MFYHVPTIFTTSCCPHDSGWGDVHADEHPRNIIRRKVMNMLEKVEVLDKVKRRKKKPVAVRCHYGVNN